MLEMLM